MSSLFVEREGSGPDLVLLHGWGCNHAVWQPVAEQLAQEFTLHLVDLPGFGQSALPEGEYSLRNLAMSIGKLVPKGSIWLGWSLGGLVAMQAALMDDIAVKRLITVASSPCFVASDGWPGIEKKLLKAFCSHLESDPAHTLNQFLGMQAMGSKTAKADTRQLRALLASGELPAMEALRGGLELLLRSDLREPLAQLTVPWLRLFGAADSLVPVDVKPLLEALNTPGLSQLFEHSSHAPFISEPDLFVNAVKQFGL